MSASAAELAFHVARAALGGEGVSGGLQVSLEGQERVTAADILAALDAAPKPTAISGVLQGSRLELRVGRPPQGDGAVEHDEPPLLPADAPDDAAILVVAFDQLLRVTKSTWRRFRREFRIHAPVAWSADHPTSAFVRGLGLPRAALEGAAVVVVLGHSVPQGFQLPLQPQAWDRT